MTTLTRHEFVLDDEDTLPHVTVCAECGLEDRDAIHDDPADDIPEDIVEAARDLLVAADALSSAIRSYGGRDADVMAIRHFSAYHLANLEGAGAGWVGSGFLVDDLRSDLLNEEVES